jgi:hypothetical protein
MCGGTRIGGRSVSSRIARCGSDNGGWRGVGIICSTGGGLGGRDGTPIDMDNTFTVRWSPDDGEYVATHSAFPSLSWLDRNPLMALNGLLTVMIEDNAWDPPANTN